AKLEKAEAKIPKKTVKKKERIVDAKTGKVTTRLSFEETEKKPPSKLTHAAASTPGSLVLRSAHREIRENEDENVGVESTHTLEQATENGVRIVESAHRSHRLKPYRTAARAAHRADRANLRALDRYAQEQNPQFHTSPYSRWQQKRAIRREYAAAKMGRSTGKTISASELSANAVKRAGQESAKAVQFVARNKKIILVGGIFAVMLLFLMSVAASCSVFVQSGISAIGTTTYPMADSDIYDAEAQYCALEADLQDDLNNYASTHDYDEYVFDLDTIEHDPYVLISAITALYGGNWTAADVGDIIQMLFEKQYILTETVTTETRYRNELREGHRIEIDPYTGAAHSVPYVYYEEVPYSYRICTVTLENCNLSHVPVYVMTEEQLSIYAVYMRSLGNRPNLFPDSAYVDQYNTEHPLYEIPESALQDAAFAAMIEEAEKYIGYPYVWGGSSPSTSFDCSGFVSWVLNHSGWSIGRLGANGLLSICTPISSSVAKPGDLIFFQNTFEGAAPGASHVGIYVGNSMFLHCGDPIQYASLSNGYWQAHFLSFGRLPSP
ncbi:MAG: C40 family peptidase, partial [Oscillospiraceae bacterium]|nr:C40 family peptidase [Oscillospiraceae bacterium]